MGHIIGSLFRWLNQREDEPLPEMEVPTAPSTSRNLSSSKEESFKVARAKYRKKTLGKGLRLPTYNDLTGEDKVKWERITDDKARLITELFQERSLALRPLTLKHCDFFENVLTRDQREFDKVVLHCKTNMPMVFNEYQGHFKEKRNVPLKDKVKHFLSLIRPRTEGESAKDELKKFVAVLRAADMKEMFVMIYDLLIFCGAGAAFRAYKATSE